MENEPAAVSPAMIEIFIAHKSKDHPTASRFKRVFENFGPGRLRCFVSEDISYGLDWYDKIRNCLASANIVVLIFTGTDKEDWAWPILEVGLATNPADTSKCKTICFHPPGSEPPDPLKHLQAVAADEESIVCFLKEFFGTDKIVPLPVVNEAFANDDSQTAHWAKEIGQDFRLAEPWQHSFTYFLQLLVEDTSPNKYKDKKVPPSAIIDPVSTALAPLFDLTSSPPDGQHWTWEGFMAAIKRTDETKWVAELGERMHYSAQGKILNSTSGSFQAADEGTYRPLLHRVNLSPDNQMMFEVIFVEVGSKGATTKKSA